MEGPGFFVRLNAHDRERAGLGTQVQTAGGLRDRS